MESASSGADAAPSQPFEFTGSGSEYFRVWIVNVSLTLLTLGVYSAWAKVRRLRYLYQRTRVAGSSFDYHGRPLAILKGRFIAVGLFVLYVYSIEALTGASWMILGGLAVVFPWLLRSSLRFRARNSSWRGLRFSFNGSPKESYFVFLLLGGLTLVFGFVWPLLHSRLKRFQHGNAQYGQTRTEFTAGDGEVFRVYANAALLSIVSTVAIFALMIGPLQALRDILTGDPAAVNATIGTLGAWMLLALLAAVYIFGNPYVAARTQNVTWNHTRLGQHRFISTISARRLTWIHVTNLLAMVATLGFYRPWAVVRVARYRAACLSLLPAGSLDEFVAAQTAEVTAAGEETGEMFDIDFAL